MARARNPQLGSRTLYTLVNTPTCLGEAEAELSQEATGGKTSAEVTTWASLVDARQGAHNENVLSIS
jgi:hypothetical protein